MINKYSAAIFFVIVSTLFIFKASPAEATSGACSSHGGVNCSAGADWDGSVICWDGWTGSSVSYYSMAQCGYSSYSSPSYTCPLFSSYDYLTGSCKCMSGYVTDTDFLGNQSCVSGDSLCHEQLGYNSDYDSWSGNCECDYGYRLNSDGDECVSHDDYCEDLYGYGAEYSILSSSCQCEDGYTYENGSCEYESSYGSSSSLTLWYLENEACKSSFGIYAYSVGGSSCTCLSGYEWNGAKTECVSPTVTCSNHASLIGDACYCDTGYLYSDSLEACTDYDTACEELYGGHTTGDANYCYCDSGYEWNTDKTECHKVETEVSDTTDENSGLSNQTTATDLSLIGGKYNSSKLDESLVDRLTGFILLQTEEHGEAWYVYPKDQLRYYMKDGDAAYEMMRSFGLGITDADLSIIPSVDDDSGISDAQNVCTSNALAKHLKGQILLQVEQHGEAWYVEPNKCIRVYMKDGDAAYSIMRSLSLGIADTDLEKMPTGETL